MIIRGPEKRADSDARRVGLVAGWGRYPLVIAQALRAQGYQTYCLGVRDHADPELANWCTDFRWIGLARLGAAIRYYHRHGVTRVTMAGKIHKTVLFQPGVWLRHLPDLTFLKVFYPHLFTGRRDRKDDTLLGTIVDACGQAGIEIAPATDFAPELLVKAGKITRHSLTPRQMRDIEFGWTLAKEMGRLDVGQSVAVMDQAVLAVEAIEGTDACIRRAGELCSKGGFTLVKVAKPQQDMRFDVPTVGLGTLENLVAAGGKVLAIEAERTILIDETQLVNFANAHGIAMVALHRGEATAGHRCLHGFAA